MNKKDIYKRIKKLVQDNPPYTKEELKKLDVGWFCIGCGKKVKPLHAVCNTCLKKYENL